MKSTALAYLFIISFGLTNSLKAEPWVDTSNLYLKANIQLLADTGHITTPVTTYPLMWHDIARDLKDIDIRKLSKAEENAYLKVSHQLKLATNNRTSTKVNTAIKDSRFTSFGDSYRAKNSIQIQSSIVTDNFALKISPSYTQSAVDGDEIRLDESYLMASIGNWVVSFGKQDRWFGPTWDTSLSLTNNARPMPALAISRKSAEPFTLPFTELDIPWTITSFMGKMDDNRIIEDTLLWGFRFNFKPLKNLEIGITRLAQWGGKGHSQTLDTFWDILLGKTNCGVNGLICDENSSNPANQQAGYDIRYSMIIFDIPVSFYGQNYAEDGDNNNTFSIGTKPEFQAGLDMHISLLDIPTTAYFEYSQSFGDCGVRDNIGDCFYEHGTYQTGMRYNGRTISHLYDNDTRTYVLGTISQLDSDTNISSKFRYLMLNRDNHDKAPGNPIIGNPLTSIAEDIVMLSTSVQHIYKNWRFIIDGEISHSTFENDIDDETDINVSLMIEYNL